MRDKTKFQTMCVEILVEKLKAEGLNLKLLSFVEGLKESYFEGECNGIKFWIYDDGASIQSKKGPYLFEALDYASQNDLLNDFIEKLIKIIKNE